MAAAALQLKQRPTAASGGLFVSPGYGRHPDRVIDSWELILVRSGCLHIEENGVEFRVAQDQSLLMPPFRRHRGLSEHSAELSFYWVHFTLSRQRLSSPVELPQYCSVPRPQRLAEWFHQFIADASAHLLTPLAADALLLLMLNETALPAEPKQTSAAGPLVRKAEEVISRELQRGIGPSEVADAIGYSTAYLSRLFRQVHGVTLGEYIHRTQIAQARTLLHNSAAPLKQISRQCGFSDEGYFRRIFRRESGISPREYRNRFGRVRINRD